MPSGIDIHLLTTPEEMKQVEEIQRQVWPDDETGVVPAHLLLALAHNGGLVLGAWVEGQLAGMLIGFLGTDAQTERDLAMTRLKHASHSMGVLPQYRDRGIGYQLKLAQRQLMLAQGIRLITWTYDPLISRNAHLNIRRLGAVVQSYYRDWYGEMKDGINRGVASDRFAVEWWITTHRVKARLDVSRSAVSLEQYIEGGIIPSNPVHSFEHGWPVPSEFNRLEEAKLVMVEIPTDYQGLRQSKTDLAVEWREHTRKIFEDLFEHGFLITDFIHRSGSGDEPPRAYYILSHGEVTFG
jgi:predicted GNAT superfamily acetyltransferase